MPGTPDPLLGSAIANWLGAFAVALALVVGPLRYRRSGTAGRIAAARRPLAAAVGLGLRAIPRVATGAFRQFSRSDPVVALALYALGTVVLALQVVGPVYSYLEYGLVAPLAAGVGATTLAVFLFFRLGGETESFSLYALFGPWVLGAILAAALVEGGLGRLVTRGVSPS